MTTGYAQADRVDFDRIYKVPPGHRYFNISTKWIFYFPWIIRAFYRVGIRHEVATALSIASGLAGAWLIASLPESGRFLAAALAVHLKDVFDATDGALARLTGTGHRLGRFVDTVGDGIVFTSWIAACAYVMIKTGAPVIPVAMLAGVTWVSLFLQCSWFNFYQLHYLQRLGVTPASRIDERAQPVDGDSRWPRATRFLANVYELWFGWQDRVVAAWDRHLRKGSGLLEDPDRPENERWYTHRGLLVAGSALCFGTHAFVLIAATLAGRPHWFLPAVSLGMNLYLAVIASARRRLGSAQGRVR